MSRIGRSDQRRPLDPLREATCLAHTIPGVSLRLVTSTGRRLLCSHHCLGADLDPCTLRASLLAAPVDRAMARFVEMFDDVEIAGGLTHLGGGLFDCSTTSSAHERWFATALDEHRIVDLLGDCPIDSDGDDSVGILIKPDAALGVSAVCLVSDDDAGGLALDRLGAWLVGAVLVAELLDDIGSETTA